MEDSNSRELLYQATVRLLAEQGAVKLSMREVARSSGVAASAIYHYFPSKDALLKQSFDRLNTQLGVARAALPDCVTASELLRQRIYFQLEHIEEVVAVLKYYLAYRHLYNKGVHGVLPDKAYLHMQEVVEMGVRLGEFKVADVVGDAQVMTHAVNGFLLEYYPEPISRSDASSLVDRIHDFLLRALKGGDVQ